MSEIKRSDAIDAVTAYLDLCCMTEARFHKDGKSYNRQIAEELFEVVRTVELKQGEWISLHNGKWKCSECGIEVLIYAKGNFCPNCGCRMKGADDE